MDLFRLREEFNRDNILMCFNGPISHSIIEELGTALRNYLTAENLARAAVLDVFAVYIELTQNARNYLSVRGLAGDAASVTVVIARDAAGYRVTAGNYVLRSDLPPLLVRVAELRDLSADELRQLHRNQLRGAPPAGGGAGLGLIDIARRSSAPLAAAARDIDEHRSFLSLTATV